MSPNSSADVQPVVFWVCNIAFLLSGMTQTLLAFELGGVLGVAKNSASFITAMGNPLGQLLFSAFYCALWRHWDRQLLLYALPMVVCELGYNFLSQVSIQNAGSGMYQVIHASVVVLNALVGCALFGKRLALPRWLALAVICAAVALSSAAQLSLPGVDVAKQTLGIAAAVAANLMVSGVYVAANVLLEKPWDRPVPKPMVLAQMLGCMEVSIILIYQAAYVVPRWEELVTSNIPEGTSTGLCVGVWVLFVLVCGVHQYAFYYTCSLGPAGAITAGINKCVQTAGLFFLSSAIFCGQAPSQCLSTLKIVSAMLVCAGVLLYAWLTAREQQQHVALEPESVSVSYSLPLRPKERP